MLNPYESTREVEKPARMSPFVIRDRYPVWLVFWTPLLCLLFAITLSNSVQVWLIHRQSRLNEQSKDSTIPAEKEAAPKLKTTPPRP
jgi:hypothetical protein